MVQLDFSMYDFGIVFSRNVCPNLIWKIGHFELDLLMLHKFQSNPYKLAFIKNKHDLAPLWI